MVCDRIELRLHRVWQLTETATGNVMTDAAQAQLESMRWMDRVGYHTWRALHQLAGAGTIGDSQVYEEPESTGGRV